MFVPYQGATSRGHGSGSGAQAEAEEEPWYVKYDRWQTDAAQQEPVEEGYEPKVRRSHTITQS